MHLADVTTRVVVSDY